MQPALMLVVITVWLFVLWFGSLALEATGMERSRARFQAISALTTSGFTTRESENVVGHPRRRLIVSWMMFLGSVGIILFLLLLFVLIVIGAKPEAKPTPIVTYVLAAIPAVILLVLFWLGVLDKLGTAIVNGLKRSRFFKPELSDTEIIYQAAEHSLARLTVGRAAPEVGSKISDTSLGKANIRVLAIERGDKVIFYPEVKEIVQAGDHLIYFGQTEEVKKTQERE